VPQPRYSILFSRGPPCFDSFGFAGFCSLHRAPYLPPSLAQPSQAPHIAPHPPPHGSLHRLTTLGHINPCAKRRLQRLHSPCTYCIGFQFIRMCLLLLFANMSQGPMVSDRSLQGRPQVVPPCTSRHGRQAPTMGGTPGAGLASPVPFPGGGPS